MFGDAELGKQIRKQEKKIEFNWWTKTASFVNELNALHTMFF